MSWKKPEPLPLPAAPPGRPILARWENVRDGKVKDAADALAQYNLLQKQAMKWEADIEWLKLHPEADRMFEDFLRLMTGRPGL